MQEGTYVLATENDALNGVCMLFGQLLTYTAQIFADLRPTESRVSRTGK